jgi:glycine/D-amino acid oxidase-like deaminating enzyme
VLPNEADWNLGRHSGEETMSEGANGTLTRRTLVRGAAASLGALAIPQAITSAAAQPCTAIGRRSLPVPNLSYSRANIVASLVGVRPHRDGGVRLELLPAVGTGAGRRYLIHNYGHGGGGITLSFGCASVVADKVQQVISELGGNARPSVAVIGSGIIGLTAAEAVKMRFPRLQVTIYSRDIELARTTSWVAGGQFEPSGIWRPHLRTPELRAAMSTYLSRSVARIRELQTRSLAARYGILERANYSLAGGVDGFENELVRPHIRGPKCGSLPFGRLSVQGREYGTWLINPRILMPRLVGWLNDNGVYRRPLTIAAQGQLRGPALFFRAVGEQIVINCTGLASGVLANDPTVRPIKGQIVTIRNPDPARFNYFFSGASCNQDSRRPNYLFCRQGDIVLGGTWFRDDASLTVDENENETIMNRLRRLFEGQSAGCGGEEAIAYPGR